MIVARVRTLRSIATAASLSLLLPALSGCATPGGGMSKPALASYPGDICGTQRADFAVSKTYFTDQILADVGTGAVIGGLAGGALGLVTGVSPLKMAAIGAGVGAAAGGVSGYSKMMAEKHKDQAELAKSVNDDLSKEGQEIDHTSATFAKLRACRFEQAYLIKTQVRRRQLDRPGAIQQLEVQRARFGEELALANEYKLSMDKRGEQFQDAANTIARQETADRQAAAAANAAATSQVQAVKRAASVSVASKRGFDTSIQTASANSNIAFDIDNTKRVASNAFPADG